LPKRDLVKESIGAEKNLEDQYELHERMNSLRVPHDSPLVMKSIAEINVGTVTGLTVVAILRNGKTILAPDPSIRIYGNDIIIIEGRLDRLNEFRGWQKLQIGDEIPSVSNEIENQIKYAEVTVSENSELTGKTYYEIHFRKKFRINVFAIKKGARFLQGNLASQIINSGDVLLIRSKSERLNELLKSGDFRDLKLIEKKDLKKNYAVQESLFTVTISDDSDLNEKTLSKSRMGAVFGLHVLAVKRKEEVLVMPMPDDIIHKHDKLVIACRQEDLDLLRGLQDLKIEKESASKIDALESEQVALVEVSLAPRSGVVGKTLRDIHFRTKYGMQVIAIWHEGRAIRTNLRDIELNFGDALLLMGRRENINLLKADPDFIVLSQDVDQVLNKKKAPVSGIIMLLFVLSIVFGWLPISIAALSAVVLMIVTGCLKIEDAYKAIDWRSIFLIAGMMPLGIAIQKTGTAQLVSNLILSLHNSVGDWGIMILLYSLITAASVVIPTSALVVFMAPIFISIAQQLGVSPYAVMMVLAVSASASFISPVSHPANVLVMGPGGYRFSDYTKVGLPLTIVVMIIGLIMISIFWPL
jgi:di/tricarboxylate transporter